MIKKTEEKIVQIIPASKWVAVCQDEKSEEIFCDIISFALVHVTEEWENGYKDLLTVVKPIVWGNCIEFCEDHIESDFIKIFKLREYENR
jgi:hypothetical protein